MCGIVGVFHLNGDPVSPTVLQAMTDSVSHRGPDDQGYLLANTEDGRFESRGGRETVSNIAVRDIAEPVDFQYNLGFGHRRLSIIDLSIRGHQPMDNGDGSIWIVHNGEIFNFAEIRSELKAKGYTFNSNTDTEVIIKSYQEWGMECVSRFNGQWAFCIYDSASKKIFCSRDRFGIRPFYYFWNGKAFVFASELKALFCSSFVERKLDEPIVFDFLWRGLLEYTHQSAYEGVNQLEPGCNLVIDINSKSFEVFRYYQLQYNSELGAYSPKAALKYAADVRELLIDAVKLRLVADVPIGSCLSGGIDSSSVVVIISKLLKDKLVDLEQIGERQKTFTAAYGERYINERDYAEEIIREVQADAHFVYPKAQGLWQELDRLIYHQDGLFGSTTIYAQWCVMRLASRFVKVVLDGQGGDELFGGYVGYKYTYLLNLMSTFRPYEFISFLVGMLNVEGTSVFRPLVRVLDRVLPPGFIGKISGPGSTASVFSKVMDINKYRERASTVKRRAGINLNQQLCRDETKFSLPALLRYEDRNGAAFSIESRVPFVDHRLVEYVSQIPSCYKLRRGWSKWLLRLAMRDMLPKRILWRKDKIGFATPEPLWLKADLEDNRYLRFSKDLGVRNNLRQGDFTRWRAFIVKDFLERGGLLLEESGL